MGIAFLISGVGECWSACGLMNTFDFLRCIWHFQCILRFCKFKTIRAIGKQTILSIIIATPEPLIELKIRPASTLVSAKMTSCWPSG